MNFIFSLTEENLREDHQKQQQQQREEATGVSPSNNTLHHDLSFYPIEAFAFIEIEQSEELFDLLSTPHIPVPIWGSDIHTISSNMFTCTDQTDRTSMDQTDRTSMDQTDRTSMHQTDRTSGRVC